jgi:hypothetical protein
MQLKHLLLLLLVTIGFGAGGWWWYQRLFQRSQVQTVTLDESLNPAEPARTTEVDSQDEALLAHVIAPPGTGLTDLPVDRLQPPFTQPACYLSAVDTCLASVYDDEISGHYVVKPGSQTQRKLLDKPEVAFAMGRILAEPDRVRRFFADEYGTPGAYLAFVRYLRVVSLENHVNPALMYALYDYLLLNTEETGHPLTMLPNVQQLADRINMGLTRYTQEGEPGDTVSRQFENQDGWTTEDKALVAGLAWSLDDPDLLFQALAEQGGLEQHYHDRIHGMFEGKPFEASFSGPDFPKGDYLQGQQASGGLAACRSGHAGVCYLAGPDGDDLWHLTCRWAPFLDEFCDGTLPAL